MLGQWQCALQEDEGFELVRVMASADLDDLGVGKLYYRGPRDDVRLEPLAHSPAFIWSLTFAPIYFPSCRPQMTPGRAHLLLHAHA